MPPTKHGMSKTGFYRVFTALRARCGNPKNPSFKNYGGRGIRCNWTSFNDFKKDLYTDFLEHIKKHGSENTSLDRINNNGNYCKENCRWATRSEQQNNTRRNRVYTLDGKTQSLTMWCREYNIPKITFMYRIGHGYSLSDALKTPIKKQNTCSGTTTPENKKAITVDDLFEMYQLLTEDLQKNVDELKKTINHLHERMDSFDVRVR